MDPTSYKKLDLFQSMEYWDSLTNTEYANHSNRNTNYTPNKPKSLLEDSNLNTFFHSISSILLTIIDEYILLYRNAPPSSHIFTKSFLDYCWTFIRKTDSEVHEYFAEQFSNKSKITYKTIGFALYCQLRALFRKNSKRYIFETNTPLHKYCVNRCVRLGSKAKHNQTLIVNIKKQIHSLRTQLNHIWIPLLFCGSRATDMSLFSISETETLLC